MLYRTSGVQVIPYENADGTHQEVIGFLKQLEEATTAPRARPAVVKEVARAPVLRAVSPPAQHVDIELSYDGAQIMSVLSHGADRTFGSARAAPDWRGLRNTVKRTMKGWDGKPASLSPLGNALTG